MLTTILTVALAAAPSAGADATVAQDAPNVSTATELQLHHKPTASDAGFVNAAASRVQLGMFQDREPVPAFGTEGSWRFQFQAGGAFEPKRTRNKMGFGGVGVSYFFIENISVDLEFNGAYFQQEGSDTGGGNLGLLLRWHLINEPTWSWYIDGGSGILLTADRVPHNGTRFNFASQVGSGFSIEIAPEMRLMTGIRWQHISNASISSNNPGRDHLLGYAMISVPF